MEFTQKYFVQANGLWVTHSWSMLGKVQLSTKREDVEEVIPQKEIDWLKTQFSDVKVYELALKEVSQ